MRLIVLVRRAGRSNVRRISDQAAARAARWSDRMGRLTLNPQVVLGQQGNFDETICGVRCSCIPGSRSGEVVSKIVIAVGKPLRHQRGRPHAPRSLWKAKMLTEDNARHLASHWIRAWNAHDLDEIMSHYAEDVCSRITGCRQNSERLIGCGKKARKLCEPISREDWMHIRI